MDNNNHYYFNNTIIECKRDSDCPLMSFCYLLTLPSRNFGDCSCDLEYGNTGPLCDQHTSFSYYRYTALSLLIAFSFISFIIILFEAKSIANENSNKFDVKFTSLILCSLSEIFFIIYNVGGLLLLSFPTASSGFDPLGRKRRYYAPVRSVGLAGISIFFSASLLNVSVLWLEVAILSKKFKMIKNPQISKTYQKAIGIFVTIFAVTICALYFINVIFMAAAGAALLLILVIV